MRLDFEHDYGADIMRDDVDLSPGDLFGDLQDIRVEELFALVTDVFDATDDNIQFRRADVDPVFVQPGCDRAPARIFVDDDFALTSQDGWIKRLVGARVFEDAVRMNSAFVTERVLTDNRFVWCKEETRYLF